MFTYKEYLAVMLPFREFIKSYDEALCSEEFTISRHEVEFDPIRALELAKIEDDSGIKSTNFFKSAAMCIMLRVLKTGKFS